MVFNTCAGRSFEAKMAKTRMRRVDVGFMTVSIWNG